jgi:hypothetical protein
MDSEGKLFDTMDLANGLEVYFYDCSREAVADRWQVQLRIKIQLEVRESYFQYCDDAAEAYETYTSSAGKTLCFELKRLRNFIEGKKVAATLSELKEEFIRNNLTYISSQDFAAKYVLRKYTEWSEEKSVKQSYPKHLQPAE